MIHTPHSSTPIQTFHQPRTPQTLFFCGWGNPTKLWFQPFSHQLSTALIFLSTAQPPLSPWWRWSDAKAREVRGKRSLGSWSSLDLLEEMTFGRWIGLPECKSAKVLVEIYMHIMCIYIYTYVWAYMHVAYLHTPTSMYIYIYISKFSLVSEVFH